MMTDAMTLEQFGTARAGRPDAADRPLRRPSSRPVYRSGAGSPVGIAVVILFHVGLFYVLFEYAGTQRVQIAPQPLEVRIVDEAKPAEPPPPPPPLPPFNAPPPPFVPAPEIIIATPVSVAAPIAATTAARPVEAAPPPPAAPAKRVLPDIDTRRSSDPAYPPESRRHGEEGLVVLLVLVESDGQASDVRLEKSSGHDRLDEAAIDGAKHNFRYIPGTVDGKPERMWLRYRYNFQLH
jgi:periplasmic protein TonB